MTCRRAVSEEASDDENFDGVSHGEAWKERSFSSRARELSQMRGPLLRCTAS